MENYYTGDTVPVKFTLTDANGPVTPSAVTIQVLRPDSGVVGVSEVFIDDNLVTCYIPGGVTIIAGVYKAYFACMLSYGERTHKVEFLIKANPEF
jgi:hypothetical protein